MLPLAPSPRLVAGHCLSSTPLIHAGKCKKSRDGLSKAFVRSAATARRTTKMLRTKPAQSAAVSSKYTIPSANHIVFNPPPTAPSPYQTPFLFLPPEDPRRDLLASSRTYASCSTTSTTSTNSRNAWPASLPESMSALPPPLKPPREKSYHLNAEDIAEMRALRAADPWTWTRARLAEKFGCTEFFAGLCAPADEKRKDWGRQNLERVKDRWGPKRRTAREERLKRRELWSRDE